MLVLTRKVGESVVIGENVTVTVVEVRGNRIRLAVNAPLEVDVFRSELVSGKDHPIEMREAADLDLARKPVERKNAHPAVGS